MKTRIAQENTCRILCGRLHTCAVHHQSDARTCLMHVCVCVVLVRECNFTALKWRDAMMMREKYTIITRFIIPVC